MMRFIRPFLESLPGVDRWGLFSLLVFFAFFSGLLWWVSRMKKSDVDARKNMPLAVLFLLGIPAISVASDGTHWGMRDDSWIFLLLTSAGVLSAMALALLSILKHMGAIRGDQRKKARQGTLNMHGIGLLASVYALSDGAFYGLIVANLFLIGYVVVLLDLVQTMAKDIAPKRRAEVAPEADVVRVPWWERVWQHLNAHVALSEEKDILLNHEYDTIRELDNKLPPWWINGFYVSVVFAVAYMFHYHIFKYDPLSGEAYERAIAEHREDVDAYLTSLALNVDEHSVKFLLAEDRLKQGRSLFNTHCVACHAPDGGGALGPNFTDEYWLHGGTIQDVFRVIKYGVPKNGMRSWQSDLSPMEIQNVATYVMSLQGTTPMDPKEPQGTHFPPAVPDAE
jgi:cytochrome c oxidase cbb3-type subunit 3